MHASHRVAAACRIALVALLALTACTSASSVTHESQPAARLAAAAAGSPGVPPSIAPRPSLARLPLAFEPNVGQAAAGVRYVSRSGGMRLEMTDGGVQLIGAGQRALGLRLVGASLAATVDAHDELPGRAHYYTTTDPAGWRTDVPMYRRVVYRNIYPSIDLVFHGDAGQLEFDFVVQPGGSPDAVRLDVTGADAVTLDGRDVVLRAGGETVRLHEPVVYQYAAAGRASVPGRFRLDGRRLAFDLGDYDRTRPLVIDPVVTYATYFGGPSSESGRSIGVDSAGNMYVALGDAGGNRVIKLSADGRSLLYTVNLGDMSPFRLVTDTAGNVYLQATCPYPRSGVTFACPVLNSLTAGHAQSQGDFASYVLKFASNGTLLFSTSMGGFGTAVPGGIALDAAGNIYATAWDVYGGFPLTGPVFSRPGGEGGFHTVVEAISADLSRFLYVVEFQTGNSFFAPRGIAVDGAGAVYLTGMIQNSLFPTTPGAFQPADLGFGGGVVAKLAPGGGSLAYSTYFGSNVSGANNINPTGIAVDVDGNAYIAGWVGNEPGLPIANAIQPTHGGGFFDAFVARLNPAGSGLVFSTYLGGSAAEGTGGMAIALDSSANVYIAGTTDSDDFPQKNPLSGFLSGNFVTEMTTDGQAFVYSTLFETRNTSIGAMTVTATGTVFLTGFTTSLNTVNPFQATYGGNADAFIAKLEPSEPRVFITSPATGVTVSGTVWTDIWVDNFVGTSNAFTLSVGGTVVGTGSGTNHVTLPWNSAAVADGSIVLTATVRDSAGHVGTTTRSLVVRNGTTPTLAAAFTSPAEGATVSGIVAIGMSETGASGTPITFTLTVDGAQVFTASGTATTASFNWNTAGVSAGAHTLGLTVRDGTGRVATATRSVTVAGSTPTLTAAFTTPAAGATVTGVVSVGMSATGASGTPITFTLTLDGTQIYTTSGTVSTAAFNWDTSTAAPGAHTLGLTVRDGAGRTATATRSVTVAGTTGSLGVFITSPAAGATVSGTVWSDIWVQGAAAGARTFTLSIGGVQLVTATDGGNHVTLPWDSTRVANGTQSLVATVRDATGNSGTSSRSLNVQNAGGGGTPTLSASFTAPAAGATVSGTVSVGMSATGASGTPIVFTLTVDGTQVFTTSGAATSASFGWNTTSVGDGAHTLGLTVSDGAGRTATATRSVTVQNATPPPPPPPPPGSISVFITEPRGGATVSGTVWFTVWIQNAATGTQTYTLTEGGRTLATVNTTSTGPVSIPWATAPGDNGARVPAVGVRDSAGSTGSATINVTVAN